MLKTTLIVCIILAFAAVSLNIYALAASIGFQQGYKLGTSVCQ